MPKHYIQNAAAGYTPAAFKGAWDDTAVAVTRALGLYPAPKEELEPPGSTGVLPSISRAETSTSGTWDVCLVRLVTAPLAANITLDEAYSIIGQWDESSSLADFVSHIHAWVTVGDSSTVRGTLLADVIGGTEWPVSSPSTISAEAGTLTSVAAQAGDRIVIEFGYRATNVSATSRTGRMFYGSSDQFLDADTGPTPTSSRNLGGCYNAVVTLNDAVTYAASMRVTALQAEVAVQAVDDLASTRITQIVVEELVTQLAATRLTQMAIEVLVAPPSADIVFPEAEDFEPARYFIRLYDYSGNLTAIIDEPKTFRIEHYLNGPSNCTLPVDELSRWTNLFKLDTIIEIWRRVGAYSYIEYTGMHRTPQRVLTEGRHRIFTSYSRGLLDLVRRRCILYKATTAFTLKDGPGEHVIKEYVNENVGPGASNALRLANGVTPGFVVASDQGLGWYYAGQNSWNNVLDVIQEISAVTSVDYDVRLTNYKPLEFTFECYYPQLGTDRRATLKFSPELGNMAEPSYTISRTEESNVIGVLGQGEGTKRRTIVSTSPAAIDSPWNRCESTADARGKDRMADYISSGEAALKERAAVEEFAFKILQTSTAQYGLHYHVGDIITAEYGSISKVKKIIGAAIDCAEGVETIEITLGDLPTRPA